MPATLDSFYAACPGVLLTRNIEAAIAALPTGSAAAAIQSAVLPLIPEGNPPQYTAGAPPAMPLIQPNATPVFAAALPPQPDQQIPIDGNSALGTVATFAKGLPRFQDSNPDPRARWSIDQPEEWPQ